MSKVGFTYDLNTSTQVEGWSIISLFWVNTRTKKQKINHNIKGLSGKLKFLKVKQVLKSSF